MHQRINWDKLALLLFVLWALFLTFEFWAFGEASYVKIIDAADDHLANRVAIPTNAELNEQGNWQPDLVAGIDRVAQVDSTGLVDLLFLVLPAWLAYAAYLFLQRFVAGYFFFLLFRRSLNVSLLFSLIPGLFFSLYSQGHINQQFEGFTIYDGLGISLVPFLLFALISLIKGWRTNAWRNGLFALALGLLFSHTSSFVFTIFVFPLILVWLLVWQPYPILPRPAFFAFTIFCAGWLALELYEVIGTFVYSVSSWRSLRASCIGVASTNFSNLPNFLHYYILRPNDVPFFFSGIAGLMIGRRSSIYKPLVLSAVLLAGYCLAALYLPALICDSPLQFAKGFNYSRFFFYIPFLLVLFGSLGAAALATKLATLGGTKWATWVPSLIAVGLIAFTVWSGLEVKTRTLAARDAGSNYANIFANPYLVRFVELYGEQRSSFRAVTLSREDDPFLSSPGFLRPYGINSLDGYTGIYPLRYAEFWNMVINPMMTTYPECRYGLKHYSGNARVILSAACDLGYVVDVSQVDDLFDFDLLSLGGARYFISTTPLTTPRLEPLPLPGAACTEAIPGCTKYYIYENPAALPLAFALSGYRVFPSYEQLFEGLTAASEEELATNAFLEAGSVDTTQLEGLGSAPAELQTAMYSSDHLQLSTSSTDGKIIAVTWNWSEDWHAWVDGSPVSVFLLDHTFMGVYVPAGEHVVDLRYLPKYTLGYWIERFKD